VKRKSLHLFSLILVFAFTLSACSNAVEATQTATAAEAATITAATEVSTATELVVAPTADLSGTITISGAFALYPMMTRWSEEFQKVYPNVKFDISAGGAGKGMTDALSGAVDIGMVSRTVTDAEIAKGAYPIAVTKDAVFPTINSKNPVVDQLLAKGISQEMFVKIFITNEVKTWGEVVGDPTNKDEIHVYTRSDACGAGEMWAKYMGSYTQDDIQGIGVNGDPGELQAIATDPLGIGYNNLGYTFDLTTGKSTEGTLAVPIDVNADGAVSSDELADTLANAVELIASGKYPAPPARLEYLVTNGKPTALVNSFINWILTDGQQYVGEAGYVTLSSDQIEEALGKLK
jgi:phosphate transport system substrate-binding protein